MRHTIEGQHGELLRVELEASEAVIADVGKLVYLRGAVEWNVVVPGDGIMAKVAAGIRRKLSGSSVMLTEYGGPGEVGFAGQEPGAIRAVELSHGDEMVVKRGGFLAASPSVTVSVALVTRLRAGLLAGHQIVLQRVTGPGTLFVTAAGDFVSFTLAAGETLRADTESLVWFDATVEYAAAWAGDVKRALLGGEGLLMRA